MQTKTTSSQGSSVPAASALDTLVEAAILAPSGDNTQPWTFTLKRAERKILLSINPARDPSPMNAGQSMARISLGAALENLLQTCEQNRWEVQVGDASPDAVIQVQLKDDYPPGIIDPLLQKRTSNRRRYDGGSIGESTLSNLRTCDLASTHVAVITDTAALGRIVPLISRADSLMLGTRSIRNAFLAKVRFDSDPNAAVDDGLSMGSLELTAADRFALRLMYRLPPPDPMLKLLGGRQTFSRVACRLAESASGFCVVSTSLQPGATADLEVGRVWQRAWLQLEADGLACQPMMSLLVLDNILTQGDPQLFSQGDRATAKTIVSDFHRLCAEFIEGTPRALMRVGFAPAPTARVRRLPATEFTSEA